MIGESFDGKSRGRQLRKKNLMGKTHQFHLSMKLVENFPSCCFPLEICQKIVEQKFEFPYFT